MRAERQTVGNGLGVHVGETARVHVVDERSAKGLQKRGERPGLGLDGERGSDAVVDYAG